MRVPNPSGYKPILERRIVEQLNFNYGAKATNIAFVLVVIAMIIITAIISVVCVSKGMCRRDEEGREDSWDGTVYFSKKTAFTLDELWNSIHGKEFASTSIKSIQSDYALNPDKVEFNGKVGGYMGAMWIHGFDNTTKFIAAQGPRNAEDFWKMIWVGTCPYAL